MGSPAGKREQLRRSPRLRRKEAERKLRNHASHWAAPDTTASIRHSMTTCEVPASADHPYRIQRRFERRSFFVMPCTPIKAIDYRGYDKLERFYDGA